MSDKLDKFIIEFDVVSARLVSEYDGKKNDYKKTFDVMSASSEFFSAGESIAGQFLIYPKDFVKNAESIETIGNLTKFIYDADGKKKTSNVNLIRNGYGTIISTDINNQYDIAYADSLPSFVKKQIKDFCNIKLGLSYSISSVDDYVKYYADAKKAKDLTAKVWLDEFKKSFNSWLIKSTSTAATTVTLDGIKSVKGFVDLLYMYRPSETELDYSSYFAISFNSEILYYAVLESDSATASSATAAAPTKKIMLNIVGIEDDFQVKARQDLPDFKIYAGDVPIAEDPKKSGDYDNFTDTEGIDAEYGEVDFGGGEEDELVFELSEDFKQQIQKIESEPYVPDSKHILDMIPGYYVTNSGAKIQVCQIDSKPVNVKMAGPYMDMRAAAAKDGVKLGINSAFRSPYDSIKGKSDSGIVISASSQKSLYDAYLSGKGNLAAEPGKSNHGNGIGLDLNTGSRKAKSNGPLNEKVYSWLVRNSWRFGFVRSVAGEEWHFDYLPDLIKQKETGKAYTKLANTEANRFYSDLGLNYLG